MIRVVSYHNKNAYQHTASREVNHVPFTVQAVYSISTGDVAVAHRVVLAPLTRMRSDAGAVPSELMVDYYSQRAIEGGLLIAEATAVSKTGQAYLGAPGIFRGADERMGKSRRRCPCTEGQDLPSVVARGKNRASRVCGTSTGGAVDCSL